MHNFALGRYFSDVFLGERGRAHSRGRKTGTIGFTFLTSTSERIIPEFDTVDLQLVKVEFEHIDAQQLILHIYGIKLQ